MIRAAVPADAAALCAIYAHYVEGTAVSFEYRPPDAAEFAARMAALLPRYPYLVCEEGGRPVGYAYAAPLSPRAAYLHSVETSIYLERDARGRGYGRALYGALERRLGGSGVRNLYACVAVSQGPDPYLPGDSLPFHLRMGYRVVGRFSRCGTKFGRWYDVCWLEKPLLRAGAGEAGALPLGPVLQQKERLGVRQLLDEREPPLRPEHQRRRRERVREGRVV